MVSTNAVSASTGRHRAGAPGLAGTVPRYRGPTVAVSEGRPAGVITFLDTALCPGAIRLPRVIEPMPPIC